MYGCKFDDPFICLLFLENVGNTSITPRAGEADQVAGVVSPEMAKTSRVCTSLYLL